MLVSIVTAVYNNEKEIHGTYECLVSQSHETWEWVVTDDGSSDDSYSLLKEIASKDDRVRVFRLESNSGAAVARNYSIDQSVGEYIAFLDSDDLFYPEKLRTQLNFMNNDKDFSFTQYVQTTVRDLNAVHRQRVVDLATPTIVDYKALLRKDVTLGCSTVMIRRRFLGARRMPMLRTGQDYAFWLSLLRGGAFAYKLEAPLTLYFIRSGSISRNKVKKALRQWQIYRKEEKLDIHKSLLYILCYGYRAVFRR